MYLELKIDIAYSDVQKIPPRPKIDWERCSEANIEGYKKYIDNVLLNFNFDSDVLTCNDMNCKVHTPYLNNLYDQIIQICSMASAANIPTTCKGQANGRVIPGWVDQIKPYREKALFWHEIWVSCGNKRDDSEVTKIRRITRAWYHLAIRSALN